MDFFPFRIGEDNPEAEAGGAAPVLHALAEGDEAGLADRVFARQDLLDDPPRPRVRLALGGRDEAHPPSGQAHELAVEQICPGGVREGHSPGGDPDGQQVPAAGGEPALHPVQDRFPLREGLCVIEKDVLVRHRDDVVVERPGVDGGRVLPDEEGPSGVQEVGPGDRFRGLPRLAGRVAAGPGPGRVPGSPSVDEDLEPGLAVGGAEAQVVGGPLVPVAGGGRKGGVVDEAALVREEGLEDSRGGLRLERAVEQARKVGRGEVDLSVGGVRPRGDGGRVRGPHARGAPAGREQNGIHPARAPRPPFPRSPAAAGCRGGAAPGGGTSACARPRPRRSFIFPSPWRAASRGLEAAPPWPREARFPAERPA